MKDPKDIYRFHVENLRSIDIALDSVGRMLRIAISKDQVKTISVHVRLYALLLGVWSECKLKKLLYEPNAFNDAERKFVAEKSQQTERWIAAIEVTLRKHYSVPRAPLSVSTLPHSVYSRYETLIEMINGDLKGVIELRNKLAHGQWTYVLNSKGDDIALSQMRTLKTENILSLQLKRRLLTHLSNAIRDLLVSRTTFERDFDTNFRRITETRRNLRNRDYSAHAERMRERYRRGQVKKKMLRGERN